jgi:nicotinate-nucleotide adenylyltransferase
MRVGVYCGTFDPVHFGHLILAEQAREQARLDQVWFVPSPRPPNKIDQSLTRFEQRVEMLQLAIAGQPAFRIDEIEKERTGPSYTVETLVELHRRHPDDALFFLVGSDTLADLPSWREPQRIVEMAGLLVMLRPGHAVPSKGELHARLHLGEHDRLEIQIVETPLIDISSRDLRRRTTAGRSLRYFVPRAVECFIHEKNLYWSG